MKNSHTRLKQLIFFFGFAFFISWSFWLPLYGHIFGINGLPVIHWQHGLGSMGPLLAAIITAGLFQGRQGIKIMLRKCFSARPLTYLLIALVSPFLLTLIGSLIHSMIDKAPLNLKNFFHQKEFPHFSYAQYFTYNLIFFGFGEETGWRGFALPRLQKKFNALSSSLILSFLWAVWHLPLFFYRPGFVSMDMAGVLGWFFSLIIGSILLSWLYNSSEGSILICAIFHSSIDLVFGNDLIDKNVMNYTGFLLTVWGILMVVVFKSKNLARRERTKA